MFWLQIARMFGARVLAITSSDDKAERITRLGPESVVNYRAVPDWDREIHRLTDDRAVDKVIDIAGGGDDRLRDCRNTPFSLVPAASRSSPYQGIGWPSRDAVATRRACWWTA